VKWYFVENVSELWQTDVESCYIFRLARRGSLTTLLYPSWCNICWRSPTGNLSSLALFY